MAGTTLTTADGQTLTMSRAARELGLKRAEFDLAVHLGRIRTLPDEGGGGRRVPAGEIERLRGQEGFPEALTEAVRTVGTTQGAALMDIPVNRFTRLARAGRLVPVRFHLNRYRAVVWHYLADELSQFAAAEDNAPLLTGRTLPPDLLARLKEGVDLRPRNWRGRYAGFLRRQAGDHPWQRAGAVAALLDPVQIAQVVPDPGERAQLYRFRPGPPVHGTPGSPAMLLAERLMTADDPHEIRWLRFDLTVAMQEARGLAPLPGPAAAPPAARDAEPRDAEPQDAEPAPTPEAPRERGLWSRLLRRGQ
ncbi:hypothetical protein C3489_23790 [Streptomyces sp. Ru71]|uniref:DUF6397 family protein n=1 Tax=Streptomyces sp. Ru71 TaxID=2080746 RepID=UPI000CDD2207|nr:DUF6397 family protein [Streptomyces sp. Ru71]POX49920.1 hypothetical protein C3489_23790 [Streptomyces sp. Ru71]